MTRDPETSSDSSVEREPGILFGEVFTAAPGTFRYGYAGADVRTSFGSVYFASVHLTSDIDGPSGDERDDQARHLLQAMLPRALRSGIPMIVMGDFNSLPSDSAIVLFNSSTRDLGAEAGLADQRTWPAKAPDQRIDYIFGIGVQATRGAVPQITTSDHLPILVSVRPIGTSTSEIR